MPAGLGKKAKNKKGRSRAKESYEQYQYAPVQNSHRETEPTAHLKKRKEHVEEEAKENAQEE